MQTEDNAAADYSGWGEGDGMALNARGRWIICALLVFEFALLVGLAAWVVRSAPGRAVEKAEAIKAAGDGSLQGARKAGA